MYNVKVSEYLEGIEIIRYDTPIFGHEKEKDGFIITRNDKELEIYSYMAFPSKKKESDEQIQDKALHSYFVSFNRTKNKIYNYARANKWEWFITITFNPKFIDSFNYDEVCIFMKWWLNHMNHINKGQKLTYLIVPEKHKSGRYHLHGVFSGLDMSVWKFQYSRHSTKSGIPIFNVGGFPYGFTTATQVQSTTRVSHYIAKYITKDMFDSIKNKKRYWVTRSASDGQHNIYMMSDCEFKILLDSIGEIQNQKSVDTPYNHIMYYQF